MAFSWTDLNPFSWNYSSFPGGGMGAGLLGLNVLGDIGGLIGNWAQQQRMRNIYKQSMDPNQIAGQAQAYANPLFAKIGPQIAEQAGGVLGQQGVSQGAYGQKIMEKALADAYANMYNQGASNYLSRLGLAAQSTGQPMGYGGTGQALQSLMLMQALRGAGGGQTGMAETGGLNPNVNWGQWGTQTYDPYGNWGVGSRVPHYQLDAGIPSF